MSFRRRPPPEVFTCSECEERVRWVCECGACLDCCECELSELFDADELGLDPEDDDRRLYHEEG